MDKFSKNFGFGVIGFRSHAVRLRLDCVLLKLWSWFCFGRKIFGGRMRLLLGFSICMTSSNVITSFFLGFVQMTMIVMMMVVVMVAMKMSNVPLHGYSGAQKSCPSICELHLFLVKTGYCAITQIMTPWSSSRKKKDDGRWQKFWRASRPARLSRFVMEHSFYYFFPYSSKEEGSVLCYVPVKCLGSKNHKVIWIFLSLLFCLSYSNLVPQILFNCRSSESTNCKPLLLQRVP